MKCIALLCLLLSACGGSAPTIPHGTLVRLLKGACAIVQAWPDDAPPPTAGGETAPQ